MTSRSTRRVSMLVAIALLTTVALLVKTAAERWLATPVDAGPLQLRLLLPLRSSLTWMWFSLSLRTTPTRWRLLRLE